MRYSKETRVLLTLAARHLEQGAYGSDLCKTVPGYFVRWWVYDALEVLVAKGLVREVLEYSTDRGLLQRTRHLITEDGLALLEETV